MATISLDDFSKLDIRIGTILSAEKVEGTDKLVKLEIDLGNETRQLVAGIAHVYEPGRLVGRQITVLANIEPKKLRGVESHGMILAAIGADGNPVLLEPEKEVKEGSKVA